MFEKTRVAKAAGEPLYRAIAAEAGQYLKWNFHKYRVHHQGKIAGSIATLIAPTSDELINAIESSL